MKTKTSLNDLSEIDGEVIANHDFNDTRTVAFTKTKKKYKQDSIAWIIWGLVLFFFTIFLVGRITVVGQFFDDTIFNFLFGWFKFPIYLLLFLIYLCIYSGIRFKFKFRFLMMIIISTLLLTWIISLVLITIIQVNQIIIPSAFPSMPEIIPENNTNQAMSESPPIISKGYTITELWSETMFQDTFNIYLHNWLDQSIYGVSYGIDKMDFLMNAHGYFNLYAGGGIAGTILVGVTAYASIPGSYILWSLFMFLNIIWIFTGDPFYLLKPKSKRVGKSLRILALKTKINPNPPKPTKNQVIVNDDSKQVKTSIWKSLNVFGQNADTEIEQSDLTIKLPSFKSNNENDETIVQDDYDLNELFGLKTTQANSKNEINEILADMTLFNQELNELEELNTLEPSDKVQTHFYQSRRTKEQAKANQNLSQENNSSSLNQEIKNSKYGDVDPQIARQLFAQEQDITPFGKKTTTPVQSNNEINDSDKQKDEIEALINSMDSTIESDTVFLKELFADENKTSIIENVDNSTFSSAINKDLNQQNDQVLDSDQTYRLPSINLLQAIKKDWSKEVANKKNAEARASAIDDVFNQFKIKAKVVNIIIGPTVTKFEIQPEPGTKVNSITALENDLKLALASQNIRLESPIPGKNLVGIEIANSTAEIVSMRELVETVMENKNDSKLLFVLGRTVLGESLTAELNKMPHLLVAGSTGAGKSVLINALIISILLRAKPNEVKFLMIDPKRVELSIYSGIPHMLAPVISDMKDAAYALKMIVNEMERRYTLFTTNASRNIESYNQKVKNNNDKLPFIVVVIDELADLLMTADRKSVEESIMRITQMARAAGIHLVVATQRPSVDIITGTIKTNIPTRIALAVTTGTDSRTILDQIGAEKLIGRGDMLYMAQGSSELIRAQGVYLSDLEIETVVEYIIKQQDAVYDNGFIDLKNKFE